ncbi:hypothetical protein CYMTET_34919 [Cymbomonas tetramitiformis]|uniref:Uncharacterized protein n=1 Tax=Cymbomonas tetramitiformis TaxID=36881 RepID=A0AAE0FA78_9CHLO|nr:hypothetical protein CYMTET_34919 [Cymbomonas tetramitiformis]
MRGGAEHSAFREGTASASDSLFEEIVPFHFKFQGEHIRYLDVTVKSYEPVVLTWVVAFFPGFAGRELKEFTADFVDFEEEFATAEGPLIDSASIQGGGYDPGPARKACPVVHITTTTASQAVRLANSHAYSLIMEDVPVVFETAPTK